MCFVLIPKLLSGLVKVEGGLPFITKAYYCGVVHDSIEVVWI
jgi:hypothetical protein